MIPDSYLPLVRLLLCLLLSFAVHGGVFFQDWATRPDEHAATDSRVVVTLLPTPDVPAATAVAERSAESPPQRKTTDAANPRPAVAKAAVAEAAAKPPAPRSSRPAPVPDQAAADPVTPAPATVCPEPREEWAACPTSPATSRPVSLPAATAPARVASLSPASGSAAGAVPAPPSGAGQRVSGAGDAGVGELVEAVPEYRSNPLPEYPYMARKKRWQGVVWLLVDVSATGGVDDLRVERSCGHGVLDRAAARTVRTWRFSPATRGGLPMASQVRIPVRFRLEGG